MKTRQGRDGDDLHGLVSDWAEVHDWRSRAAALNRLPHFMADIEGTANHFIHARGEGRQPVRSPGSPAPQIGYARGLLFDRCGVSLV